MFLQRICLWMAFSPSIHNTPKQKQNTENSQFHMMRIIFQILLKLKWNSREYLELNTVLSIKGSCLNFYIYQFKKHSNQFCRLDTPNFLHRHSSLILLEKYSQHFTIIGSYFHYFLQGGLSGKGTGSFSQHSHD